MGNSAIDPGGARLLHSASYSGAALGAVGWVFSTYFTPQAGDVIKAVVSDVSLNSQQLNRAYLGWNLNPASNHIWTFGSLGTTPAAINSGGPSNASYMLPITDDAVTAIAGFKYIHYSTIFVRFHANGATCKYRSAGFHASNNPPYMSMVTRGMGAVGFGHAGGMNTMPNGLYFYANQNGNAITAINYKMYKLSAAQAAAVKGI